MGRLVRQHRIADDVTNGEDVRHIGTHLPIHQDETALADLDTGLLGADLAAVGRAPHRDQHAIVG